VWTGTGVYKRKRQHISRDRTRPQKERRVLKKKGEENTDVGLMRDSTREQIHAASYLYRPEKGKRNGKRVAFNGRDNRISENEHPLTPGGCQQRGVWGIDRTKKSSLNKKNDGDQQQYSSQGEERRGGAKGGGLPRK